MPQTPADLWARYVDLPERPPEALLGELRARLEFLRNPLNSRDTLANGACLTENYRQVVSVLQDLFSDSNVFRLENLVSLRADADEEEISSYGPGLEMSCFLTVMEETGTAPVNGIISGSQIKENIFHIIENIICAQCLRPEVAIEVPTSSGKIPLSGRPVHLAALRQHKEEVVEWFKKPFTEKEIQGMQKLEVHPRDKEERNKFYGPVKKKILNMAHGEMGASEFPASFHSEGIWKLRTDKRTQFLGATLLGVNDPVHLVHNINREKIRFPGQKINKDTMVLHIDADVRTLDSPHGSKVTYTHAVMCMIPGFNKATWKYVTDNNGDFFNMSAARAPMSITNMPKDSKDVFGLCELGLNRYNIYSGGAAIWNCCTPHYPSPESRNHFEIGTYSALPNRASDRGQSKEDNFLCWNTGVQPKHYPSGPPRRVTMGVRQRDGPMERHFNYVHWFENDLTYRIDDHWCANRLRLDSNGFTNTLYVKSRNSELSRWRSPILPPVILESIHREIQLSNTDLAMLGRPHVRQVIAPSNFVGVDAVLAEGASSSYYGPYVLDVVDSSDESMTSSDDEDLGSMEGSSSQMSGVVGSSSSQMSAAVSRHALGGSRVSESVPTLSVPGPLRGSDVEDDCERPLKFPRSEKLDSSCDEDGKYECSICLDEKKTHAFMPCGHMCVCTTCAASIMASSRKCPICRVVGRNCVKVYL